METDTLNSGQLPIPFSTWINEWSEASENTEQGFTENKTKPRNKTKNPQTPQIKKDHNDQNQQ